jgi:ABC-2 type transport system ATP-binding protein
VSTAEFIEGSSTNAVRVRSPRLDELAGLLRGQGLEPEQADGVLRLRGVTTARVGDLAAEHGIALHELVEERASLEAAFMEMTRDSVEYHAEVNPGDAGAAPTDEEARS